ncbi:nucleotidyltransferase family protein [Terribacillus saccharophilus]|uniref:hypothetical protein n=1 Tax=Terribacillus saccharophilus TaxID=361277 RepID=UPI001475B13C|nr:hypothetical protein [Terribacillus goriensis]
MDQHLIDFIDRSKQIVIGKKEVFQKVEKDIRDYVENKFIKNIPLKNISIHTRIKNEDSLGEKVIRSKVLLFEKIEPETFIDNLKDIIGMRLVCLLNNDEKKLYEEIQKYFNISNTEHKGFFELEGNDKSSAYLLIKHAKQPEEQKNGKEIYKMECLWVENEQITPVELQIKSLVHMFWGELEHKLIYKNYAYDEQQSFYTDIMLSINDLLSNIDSQLTTINTHLKGKGAKEQKLRAKEMLATEFYINLQTKLNSLLINYDIDFREVYALLSQLLSLGKNHQAIVHILSTQITHLSTIRISKENFEFTEEELRIEREEHLKLFGQIVSKLILSHDVVWRILFGLYHLLNQNETTKVSFKSFVGQLHDIYNFVINEKVAEVNELIETKIVEAVILPSISKGLISAFSEYSKMDFFIEKKKLNIVLETTEEFIDFMTSNYENFQNKVSYNSELIELLGQKLKLQILLNLSVVIEYEELNNFKTKLQTNPDWVFDLDYDKIDELFKSELTIEGRSRLVHILNTKIERDGEIQNDPS